MGISGHDLYQSMYKHLTSIKFVTFYVKPEVQIIDNLKLFYNIKPNRHHLSTLYYSQNLLAPALHQY